MKHLVRQVFLSILGVTCFLILTTKQVEADGVQLSTYAVGSTAVFTAQIPPDPCKTHNLGETKTRTVVGFIIDSHPIDDDGVVRTAFGKPNRVDLSEAQVSELIIGGQKITDFYEDPGPLGAENIKDFLPMQRVYLLKSPMTFTQQDSASIVVTNVKIREKGRIVPWFGLNEPNGIYCLASKYTILTVGSDAVTSIPTKTTETPTHVPTLAPTSQIVVSRMPTKGVRKPTSISRSTVRDEAIKNRPFLQKLFDYVWGIFH